MDLCSPGEPFAKRPVSLAVLHLPSQAFDCSFEVARFLRPERQTQTRYSHGVKCNAWALPPLSHPGKKQGSQAWLSRVVEDRDPREKQPVTVNASGLSLYLNAMGHADHPGPYLCKISGSHVVCVYSSGQSTPGCSRRSSGNSRGPIPTTL
jgi:hypothetical protein